MASHGIYLTRNGSTGGGYGRGTMDDLALDTKNRSHWISSPTLPFIFITNMQDGERCGAISLIQRVQESLRTQVVIGFNGDEGLGCEVSVNYGMKGQFSPFLVVGHNSAVAKLVGCRAYH
jgi:hypothetical protein